MEYRGHFVHIHYPQRELRRVAGWDDADGGLARTCLGVHSSSRASLSSVATPSAAEVLATSA